jgi:hypothetical protein
VKELRPKAAQVDVLEVQLQAEKDQAAELRELRDGAMTPTPVPSLFDQVGQLRRLLSGPLRRPRGTKFMARPICGSVGRKADSALP